MITMYLADGHELEFPAGRDVRAGRADEEPFSVVIVGEADKELARFRPEHVRGYVLDGVVARQHGHSH